MKKLILFLLVFSMMFTLTYPVSALSSDQISTELIDPKLEITATSFLNAYLRDIFLYEESPIELYTIASLTDEALTSIVSYENKNLSVNSFLNNIYFINDKIYYWKHIRTAYNIVRRDFHIEHNILDCDIINNIAYVTVVSSLSYQYVDSKLPTYEELVFHLELLNMNGNWLIIDMSEQYSWFDALYKDNPTFNVDTLIYEFDSTTAPNIQDSYFVSEYTSIDEVSPMALTGYAYNKSNATAYAYTYTTSESSNTASDFHNQNFYDWSSEGGDCISFVSQCIWAGFGGSNLINTINSHSFPMDTQGSNKWYSSSTRNYSNSWISNGAFRTYADGSNQATSEIGLRTNRYWIDEGESFSSISNYATVLLGSLLQVVAWNGDDYGHAVIVTDVEGSSRNQVYYCAHTNMAKHKKLTDGGYGSCPIYVYAPTSFYTGSVSTGPIIEVTMYRPVHIGTQLTLTATSNTTYAHFVQRVTAPSGTYAEYTFDNTSEFTQSHTFSENGLYTIHVFGTDAMFNSIAEYTYTIRTYD